MSINNQIAVVQEATTARLKEIDEEKKHALELINVEKEKNKKLKEEYDRKLKEDQDAFKARTEQGVKDTEDENKLSADNLTRQQEGIAVLVEQQESALERDLELKERAAEQEALFEEAKNKVIGDSKENLNRINAGLEISGIAKTKAGQVVSKAIALTQIGIDSAVALSKASTIANAEGVAAQLAFPLVPGVGTVARVLSYTSTAASVISNISKAKQLLNGGGASSSSGGQGGQGGQSFGTNASPQVGFQASSENQIATTISNNTNELPPQKVYVVESEISEVQNGVKAQVESNSF